MASKIANKFYNSKQWEDCRAAFISSRIQIDGGMCQRCHEEPGYIVHHKVWLNAKNIEVPEVSLNFENLEFLCHICHDDEHIHRPKRLLCGFDENGRPMNGTAAERDKDKY